MRRITAKRVSDGTHHKSLEASAPLPYREVSRAHADSEERATDLASKTLGLSNRMTGLADCKATKDLGAVGIAPVMGACAVDSFPEETIASSSEAVTSVANGTCATHYQLAAEAMRAAMVELKRYALGLDLLKDNGRIVLAPTTAEKPDLDEDGEPDGMQRCVVLAGCPELTSLLNRAQGRYPRSAG